MKDSQEHTAVLSEKNITDTNDTCLEKALIKLTVVHNRDKHELTLSASTKIADVKKTLESLTHVPSNMQKLIYRGMLSDDARLEDLCLPDRGSKFMLVGTQLSEAEQLRLSEAANHLRGDDTRNQAPADSSEDWCERKDHKHVLERFGKPENAMIGIINSEEILAPDECLVGLCDKRGQPLRLRIKSESSELWLATKDVTHKIPLATIHEVVSQPIKDHPEYHIMAFQLGPTEQSRHFVYWLPSQYVESIKTMVLQHKILNSVSGATSSKDSS